MRGRAWTAMGCVAAGLTIGIAGGALPGEQVWNLFAGMLVLAAIILGISLLPVWARLAPEPLPGLFVAPGPRERWCVRCGHPTLRQGACRTCGHTPAARGK